VVGTREHVGLGRLLVGSISHYCLTHATCPVVAVPAKRPDKYQRLRPSARCLTPCSMSCDIKKSAGTISSQPASVNHQGAVTHRDRKRKRVR
jgi:hypothetical protein